MSGLSRTRRMTSKVVLVLCIVAPVVPGAVRVWGAERQVAKRQAEPKVSFVGVLAGPADFRKKQPTDGPMKVGADPCHSRTTEGRNACDSVVDIIAGAARDDRPEAIAMGAPRAVLTDSAGRVLVADSSVPGIHVFDNAKGKYSLIRLAAEGAPAEKLTAMALGADDAIYVAEQRERVVLVYNSRGKLQRVLGRLGDGERLYELPSGVGVDAKSGRVFVADSARNYLFVLDRNGKLVKRVGKRGGGSEADAFRGPRDVVVRAGLVYVLDAQNLRVQVLDLDGNFKRQIATGREATCMAVDDAGTIYLGDSVGGTVAVVDGKTGEVLGVFGREVNTPVDQLTGVWVAPDGYIYVSNATQRRVEVFRLATTARRD